MKHITTDKGDIGVLKVSADLIEQGYPIFTPVGATCPFDLLVLKDDTFLKVQVKYRGIKRGIIHANFSRAVIGNGKVVMKHNMFCDVIAFYCTNNKKCYYVHKKDLGKNTSCISLRFETCKNGQRSHIRMAKDFEKL